VYGQAYFADGFWGCEVLDVFAFYVYGELGDERVTVVIVHHGFEGFEGAALVVELVVYFFAFGGA
jgi:hypothetical protein